MNSISPATLRAAKPFYTIGYSGKTIEQFIQSLQLHQVATLVDIRYAPVSLHKPQFSKRNLQEALAERGIAYVHLRSLGIQKEIRNLLAAADDHEALFHWYDTNVVPRIEIELRDLLADIEKQPLAFMCMEHDPNMCHRSRLAAALRLMGLTGSEIS